MCSTLGFRIQCWFLYLPRAIICYFRKLALKNRSGLSNSICFELLMSAVSYILHCIAGPVLHHACDFSQIKMYVVALLPDA